MNPEQEARQDIDRQLRQCGWAVQGRTELNIAAAQGVAVREFPMLTGEADYLLYAAGRAIGVVEAKPKGQPLPRSLFAAILGRVGRLRPAPSPG